MDCQFDKQFLNNKGPFFKIIIIKFIYNLLINDYFQIFLCYCIAEILVLRLFYTLFFLPF